MNNSINVCVWVGGYVSGVLGYQDLDSWKRLFHEFVSVSMHVWKCECEYLCASMGWWVWEWESLMSVGLWMWVYEFMSVRLWLWLLVCYCEKVGVFLGAKSPLEIAMVSQ